MLVTFYGTGMDIPYTRSRALYNGIEFPGYRELYHLDLFYTARNKLLLSRKSLAVTTKFLGIPGKMPFDFLGWTMASFGNPAALKGLVQHNIQDVVILEEEHDVLEPFVKFNKNSI
jgi:uncharacterized protein YprB with RNaseH-like and TPR domain